MDNLSIDQRLDLIKQVGEEIVTEEELRKLLETETNLIAYDGFEPSGQMHIAQGILRAINVNKMTKAGFKFKMLVADWFAYLNNKMGGDMEKIRKTGEYFVEVWKAAGMDMDNVEFVWTSEMIADPKYWELMLKIAKANSLKRVLKTTQIMGRSETDELSSAQIVYPLMQATDIFMLGAHVTQLGMDQRKVNMLARDVAPQLGLWKPISVSHHMLQGLGKPVEVYDTKDWQLRVGEGEETFGSYTISYEYENDGDIHLFIRDNSTNKTQKVVGLKPSSEWRKALGVEIHYPAVIDMVNYPNNIALLKIKYPSSQSDKAIALKMSKSIPDTAIFMTDALEDITRKIRNAYCPPGYSTENPILDYCKHIIFESIHLKGHEYILNGGFRIHIKERNEDIFISSYDDLEVKYENGYIDFRDLKNAVVEYIDQLLQPVREHFANDIHAKQLLEEIQSYQVTR